MSLKFWIYGAGVLVLGLVGCAQGDIVQPAVSCDINEDCPASYLCSPITKSCFLPMTDLDMRPLADDGGLPDMKPKPGDMADMKPPGDMTPSCVPACDPGQSCVEGSCVVDVIMCDPACKATEECKMGTCVPVDVGACTPACAQTEVCDNGTCKPVVCDPACDDNGLCTRDGCQYPSCTKEGDACDGTTSDQGNFWCLTNTMTTRTTCYAKCPQDAKPDGCARGQYCDAPIASNAEIKICVDAQCQQDTDCDNGAQKGTCIKIDNGYAYCAPAGSVGPGGTCDTSNPALRCQQGSACTSTGICRKLCDPWARPSQCGAGDRCNIFTTSQGICVNNPDASGMSTYDPCTTPNNYCADGTICLSGATNNFCYKNCRIDANGNSADCAGLAISGSRCDPYFYADTRELGICQPSCMSNAECGNTATRECVGGLCRRKCAAATVVQDCCGGNQPCARSCVSGLCE